MRILIISHFFPPLNRMASSRPYSWAVEFAGRGHEVVVLTTEKNRRHGPLDLNADRKPFRLVPVGYPLAVRDGVRGGLAGLAAKVLFRINRMLWPLGAAASLWRLRDRPPDVVLSSFGPTSMHILGWIGKALFPRAVWVADYRDLWADNPYARRGAAANELIRWTENRITGAADLILTVAESLAETLRQRFPGVPVAVVYNGYETDLGPPLRAADAPRRVVYTGTIYTGKRDPSPLLRALAELVREGALSPGDLQVDFYGDRLGNVPELVEEHAVGAWVRTHGPVPREASHRAQRGAALLLFLELGPPEGGTELTGKVFEYIAAGVPVLGVGSTPATAVGQLLEETGTGLAVARDTDRIKDVLRGLTNGTDRPAWYRPAPEAIKRYSRSAQAERCLDLIEALHRRSRGRDS